MQSSHLPYRRIDGFTIVELLVVIVVIAILAAVSIVSYNGIQRRANDSVVTNDMKSNIKRIQLFQAEYDYIPTKDELWAAPVEKDLRMTISRKSLYSQIVYRQVVQNWGQPVVDIILEVITPDGRTGAISLSSGQYRDITAEVSGGATTCQVMAPAKVCSANNNLLFANGATSALVVKAP